MKKSHTTIIILLVFTSIFWNCKQERVLSKSRFEQAVFYEIFPYLLDSIHFDRRLMPPPPPEYLEKRGYDVKNMSNSYNLAYENWKKSTEYKNLWTNWKIKRDSIVKDTTSIYLIVQDSVLYSEGNDKNELIKYFKKVNLKVDSLYSPKGYRIELSKLKTNKEKIKFKYQSNFPKGREFWKTEYDFYIAASVGFTRIQFDQTKTFGVLNARYTMGILNGFGVRVFIRKNKEGKWTVDKVVNTWIS